MKKVLPFYIVATLCLFFALFSVLTLTGSVEPDVTPEETEEPLAEETVQLPPPPKLDYPDLVLGRTYSVSHPTTVVDSPEGITDIAEELPAGGFFRVDDALNISDRLWYRVTVNNGVDDYAMYLKAEDLNWKSVDWRMTRDDRKQAELEKTIADFRKNWGDRNLVRSSIPEPEPVVKEPLSLEGVFASISSQGMFISALIAGGATFIVVFALAFIVYFRSTHRWSGSGDFNDFTSEMGEDHDEDYGERELPAEDDSLF